MFSAPKRSRLQNERVGHPSNMEENRKKKQSAYFFLSTFLQVEWVLTVSQDTMIWTQLLSEILTAEPSSLRVRPLQGSEDTSSGLANELKEASLEHTTLEESTHRERPALTKCQSCWYIDLFYLNFTSLVVFCYSTGSGKHTGHRWNTDGRLQAFQVLRVPLGEHYSWEGLPTSVSASL